MGKSSFAVVVPIFNEQDCISELYSRLNDLRIGSFAEFDFKTIFVDDGSSDLSKKMLADLDTEPWVEVIFLARNFGHQIAVTAGMDYADADYVAILDGDLQDPPELLPAMLNQLCTNSDSIVYGQRLKRDGESAFKIFSARFFYRLIRKLSNLDIPLDTGDFRVMTRVARNTLCSMREHNRFLRGLAPWTGLQSSPFLYDREKRFAGTTKYKMRQMLLLSFNAIITFSTTPIRLIQWIGLMLTVLGSVGLFGLLLVSIIVDFKVFVSFLICLNVMLGGFIILSVGIVGGYVHRIQDEVRNRPLYLVEGKN